MGRVIVDEEVLNGIGSEIIAKGGAKAPMKPSEMSAAIQAIPSGVGTDFKDYVLHTLEDFDAAVLLGYDSSDPAVQANQQMFAGFSNLRRIYSPMINCGAAFAYNCQSLVDVTVRIVSNRADLFSGCVALARLTTTRNTASQIIGYTAMLGSLSKECVIHCTDKDVEYIDGAWVIVERS